MKNSGSKTKLEITSHKLLTMIFDYVSKIANERNMEKLLIILANMGRDLIAADRCTVWLIDRKTNCLWSKVAHGVDRITIPITKGIAGWAATHGEPVIINDPYDDKRFDKDIDKQTGYRTKSIIAIPIRDSAGEMIGVFQAINKLTDQSGFSQEDMEHLLITTTYTGKQLEAFMLQEEIEKTQREIIFTLAETGEMRSKETGNHVKRVAEYSRLLALLHGLPQEEAELLKLSSPMHDIGKIAIPDSILLKTDKLTDKEYEIMRTHTTLGYEMLRHSERKILTAAAVVAFQHHEKWDGSGYPRGIKGKQTHIYGRITAVADVFDALSSDRYYKKAWPLEKILQYMGDQKGKHFEARLVDALLNNLDDFLKIKQEYEDREFH